MNPNIGRCLSRRVLWAVALIAGSIPLSAQRIIDTGHAPFNAFVLCVDTSLSPLPREFDRSKQVLKDLVDRKVTYDDVVWLVEIHDRSTPALPFPMPGRVLRRSDRDKAESLPEAKNRLKAAIDELEQRASTTDLHDPLERGLQLLRGVPRAETKTLVVIADFVQDMVGGQMSPFPTPATPGVTAKSIYVNLLFAQPKPEYLGRLNLSATKLYQIVDEQWRTHFNALGAAGTSAQLLEGIVIRPSR